MLGSGFSGEVGFEVDGSSFAGFMKSFMFMLRNVDYQKIELMMEGRCSPFLCAILLLWRHKGYRAIDAMYIDVTRVLVNLVIRLA